MNKYRNMFSASQWQDMCNEAYKERFIADYSYCINEEPESFEPRNQLEREYFDEAFRVYLERRGIDISDCETFGYVHSEMENRGWITLSCPCCKSIFIAKVSVQGKAKEE